MEKTTVKMLIVEDDFTSRVLMQELLKGFGVPHVAVDGKEAVEAFRTALDTNEPYDLVCLDIMMPELDGQAVLSECRAMEESRGIVSSNGTKILMTTALSDLKSVTSAFHSFCDGYLTKPIRKAQLLEELRKLGLLE